MLRNYNEIIKNFLIITGVLLMTGKISSQTPLKAETVLLNGSTIYYEVYGKGKPLFLLHAFTQSSKSWLPYVPDYVNDFQVYLVDLKGHGNSGMFKEKLSIRSAAEDLKALISYLNITSIDAIGYSYGGEILFQLALLQPGLINSMIIIGSSGSWNAKDFPEWVEYLSYKNIENLPWMREQQQNEEQIKAILEQMPNYNVSVSEDEMKTIKAKVLFVIGDQDESTPLNSITEARKNLLNSFLWVVPAAGHGAHKDKNKENFIRISKEFFNGDGFNKK